MQFLQIVGVLIIINTLTCAGWFVANDKSLGRVGITLVICSVLTGLALTFHERAIEITFGKVATLKAAAEQATTDAKEIAKIRQRVEAQAATLDLVAKASADARLLLETLGEENKKADEKLKLLEQKTSEIYPLADGRVRMGVMITGEPSVLKEHLNQMLVEYKTQRYEAAYDAAKDCIKIYEDSKKGEGNVAMTTGGVRAADVALLYTCGAELAQRFGDHASALLWAEKAAIARSSPEIKALLVTALLNSKKPEAAQKLINDTLAPNDQASEKFKVILQENGVLKK